MPLQDFVFDFPLMKDIEQTQLILFNSIKILEIYKLVDVTLFLTS